VEGSAERMNLTNEDVQEILRLLDASTFDELHLSTDRFKLTLRRSAVGGWTQEMQTAGASVASAPATGAAQTGTSPASGARPAGADGLIEVRPPIIGTFYRAPKPGAAPFVEVGSRVEKETVVGIVETMKLMNSVYAGAAGVVVEICAANGHLVEQDHVLMRLRAP
jgi:acetyl-CoA carboxylase biotin carboxyl carrier protein